MDGQELCLQAITLLSLCYTVLTVHPLFPPAFLPAFLKSCTIPDYRTFLHLQYLPNHTNQMPNAKTTCPNP